MKKVTVSAPGKVILLGEHAVVYGKPAIISAINMRLTVTVSDSKEPEIIAEEGKEYIHHILTSVGKHLKIDSIPPLRLEISSDIPIGYHLGSSAALGAAIVGALVYHWKKIWNPMLINQLAYESEKFIHVNSSGVDPAAVVSGGLIWYRKELDFLRSIWQLPFKPTRNMNHFFLINTGRPKETTGEMVGLVKEKMQKEPEAMNDLLNRNELQVKRVTVALKEGNEPEFLDAIKMGERTLEGMGVVSDKVIPLIREIEIMGGAAKILGGGGRADGVGYLFCYHHEPKKIALSCKKYSYSIQEIRLGEEGVRLENK